MPADLACAEGMKREQMDRLVFHVDVNSAFLSWSAVRRLREDPAGQDLRTIPSAVGGDPKKRTGIVLAKSVSAKKYGVKTGEPLVHALKKCPQLVVIPPDFRIYREASEAMMELLGRYAPVLEKFSIDEAFLDMTGTGRLYPDPMALARTMQEQIQKELGFTVNIGISVNKLLAKMASDFEKPNRVHTLFPEEIPAKMWPLPVSALLYVGRQSVEKLNRMGIETIGELARTPEPVLQRVFGMKQAHQLHEYANGRDESPVGETEAENKGYSNSITLPCDLTRSDEVYPVLLALADSVGSRLRADHMTASSISISIKDCTFHTVSHQKTLSQGTDGTDVIYRYARELFDQLWDRKTPIRLLGLSASRAVQEEYYQYTLFDETARKKAKALDQMVDVIRRRYGSDSLKRASLLGDEKLKRVGRKHRREGEETTRNPMANPGTRLSHPEGFPGSGEVRMPSRAGLPGSEKEPLPGHETLGQKEQRMEKYAIWDLDGTLLDSLSMWQELARRYLTLRGVTGIPDDLEEIIDPLSLEEAAHYLKEQFGFPESCEEIINQFMSLVRRLYSEELPFFEETRKRVLERYAQGCRMCLLTTTEIDCARAALERGRIRQCFERIYTCTDLGMNKRGPEIYLETCRRMGYSPAQTMIYEDADYALESARSSGCMVTAVENGKIKE